MVKQVNFDPQGVSQDEGKMIRIWSVDVFLCNTGGGARKLEK